MQVAPGFDSAEWQSLKLDDPNSPDWAKAISICESRISGRFIEPVDFLIATDEKKPATERRFGFAVMAIDCLLVETLGAFLAGLENTKGKSEATFCSFLTTRPLFKADFTLPWLLKYTASSGAVSYTKPKSVGAAGFGPWVPWCEMILGRSPSTARSSTSNSRRSFRITSWNCATQRMPACGATSARRWTSSVVTDGSSRRTSRCSRPGPQLGFPEC